VTHKKKLKRMLSRNLKQNWRGGENDQGTPKLDPEARYWGTRPSRSDDPGGIKLSTQQEGRLEGSVCRRRWDEERTPGSEGRQRRGPAPLRRETEEGIGKHTLPFT